MAHVPFGKGWACIAHVPFGKEGGRFFNESANQKQDLSGCLVFLPLGWNGENSMDVLH